jgi:hypothetical protein
MSFARVTSRRKPETIIAEIAKESITVSPVEYLTKGEAEGEKKQEELEGTQEE